MAGTYRRPERNIGIAANGIPAELLMMFADIRYWTEHARFPPDEIAVRFHHPAIPFRTATAALPADGDLLIEHLGGEPFNWGGGNLADIGPPPI